MRRLINPVFGVAGLLLLFASVLASSITLTKGDYRDELRFASVCAALALACFGVPLVRGPNYWRLPAAALMLATLYEVWLYLPRILH